MDWRIRKEFTTHRWCSDCSLGRYMSVEVKVCERSEYLPDCLILIALVSAANLFSTAAVSALASFSCNSYVIIWKYEYIYVTFLLTKHDMKVAE